MKERPILFSMPMVQAIQSDRKFQTRRAINPQPDLVATNYTPVQFKTVERVNPETSRIEVLDSVPGNPQHKFCNVISCPYGQKDDRLWVKETFFAYGRWEQRYSKKKQRNEWHFLDETPDGEYRYFDNPPSVVAAFRTSEGWFKRPSIFMPRKASRLLLEVAEIRAEQLRSISKEDAIAEGIDWVIASRERFGCRAAGMLLYRDYSDNRDPWQRGFECPIQSYLSLYEAINGAFDNPSVWVVGFKKVGACSVTEQQEVATIA